MVRYERSQELGVRVDMMGAAMSEWVGWRGVEGEHKSGKAIQFLPKAGLLLFV